MPDNAKPAFKETNLAELWESYKKILPPDASPNQIIETRRAFYAGCQGLYFMLMHILDPSDDVTDMDMAIMASIDKELKDFMQLLKDGVA